MALLVDETKPLDRRFRIRWPEGPFLKFLSDLFLLTAFTRLGVHSASDRSEYQGISLWVQCGRRVELTAVPS